MLQELVFEPVFFALVVCFEDFQPRDIDIQVHFFADHRVARAQGLYLREGEDEFIDVLAGTHRRTARHDLGDEALLVLERLI